jgi:hypothetical protein
VQVFGKYDHGVDPEQAPAQGLPERFAQQVDVTISKALFRSARAKVKKKVPSGCQVRR